MKIHSKLYIGGEWVDPLNPSIFEVVNPLTETVCATVAGGGEDDVARADFNAPFGGYKQSGNGREWGEIGFDEFLEYKSVLGSEI